MSIVTFEKDDEDSTFLNDDNLKHILIKQINLVIHLVV